MIPTVYTKPEHRIDRRLIDPDALKVLNRLARSGFEARLVGGGVRDLLLNKTPKDFDVATSAKPNEIRRIFNNSRIIGKRFKLVHVYFGRGKVVEVATFRDADSGCSENEDQTPEVKSLQNDNTFGTEETDALRRDLTVNGLFYDAETETIIDYVDGMLDLRRGIIRIIGEPNTRFVEDPVRMLRVVRHAVRAGFTISSCTWEALLAQNHLLQICAPMRLYEEFRKDMGSTYALPILRLLLQGKLLQHLVPQITSTSLETHHPLSQLIANIDSYNEINEEPPFSLLLSGLFICLHEGGIQGTPPPEEDTLEELLNERFRAPLGIPRRIRENTLAILKLWYRLLTHINECQGEPDIKSLKFSRKEARHAELVLKLHRVLPAGQHDQAIYHSLVKIKKLGR